MLVLDVKLWAVISGAFGTIKIVTERHRRHTYSSQSEAPQFRKKDSSASKSLAS
jgi:hypothetical protein